MTSAFLTEMGFEGKISPEHPNMRTEFAWMCALQSDHYNIHNYEKVAGYDVIFVIFPKATVKLNKEGKEMLFQGINKDIAIYSTPIIKILKENNKKVCYIQEGPADFFTDYSVLDQFNFYNQLAECDIIFAHNEYNIHFYKGLFPQSTVAVIPSLMFPPNIPPQLKIKEEKAIIGGNFCSWYNGFQSYITATEFDCPIYVPSSHCKRIGEEQVPNLNHLPWIMWNDWMLQLCKFKYAVNLMPTIAAGTFSMNCAYFGIPCIGNEKVDTQQTLFPELSIDINDIHTARLLAIQLRTNIEFYEHISYYAKTKILDSYYIETNKKWLKHIKSIIE